jgi:ATP-dependent Clp protease protease subunit
MIESNFGKYIDSIIERANKWCEVFMAIQTELTDHLAYGVDLKNRRIYFGANLDTTDTTESTDFTMSSVEYAIRAIHRMASDAPNKPIEIHMSSFGGDTYSALRLHDEILACPCQIKFYGGGAVMSSATLIMACCDERNLYPNASVMVHELSTGSDGRHTDIQVNAGEDRRLMKKLYKIYADNSRMPEDFWEDICQRDLYLTAGETVSLGLADKILEPKKRGNLRKMRHAAMKKEIDNKEMNKLVKDLYSRINRIKVPKIELNDYKKEECDPDVTVESTGRSNTETKEDNVNLQNNQLNK